MPDKPPRCHPVRLLGVRAADQAHHEGLQGRFDGVDAAGEPVELAVDYQYPGPGREGTHGADHGRNGGEGFDHVFNITRGPVPGYGAGTCRSGMGSAAKSRWAGLAIRRAHWVDRDTRALSVDRPVLANICR